MTDPHPSSDELQLAPLPEDDLPAPRSAALPEEPEVSVEEMIVPPPRATDDPFDLQLRRAAEARAEALLQQAAAIREEERLKQLTPPLQVATSDILLGVTAACVGLALAIAPLGGLLTGLVGGLAFAAILAVLVVQPIWRGWYVAAFSLLGAYLAAVVGMALVTWLRG